MPSLDGWRAISVLGVMFDHDSEHFVGGRSLHAAQDFGGSFVLIFFAISGLLICTRLLDEEERCGRIDWRGFLLRRFFRIQPAALVYLGVLAVLGFAGWVGESPRYWVGSLLLYRNYLHPAGSSELAAGFFTAHFWTLAVEEHFYLLLSMFLLLVRTRRHVVMTLLLGASVAWPLLTHNFSRGTGSQLQYFVLPALLALLLRRETVMEYARRWLTPWRAFAGTGALLGGAALMRVSGLPAPAAHDVLFRAWPFWIVATMLHPESLTTRMLETRVLSWVGRISYSLYLWQMLFFRRFWPMDVPQPHSPLVALTHAPWNFVFAFGLAALSYYLVETPLIGFGRRIAARAAGRGVVVVRPPHAVPGMAQTA